MSYPDAAWERAMKVQDVLMKGISGEWSWSAGISMGGTRSGAAPSASTAMRPPDGPWTLRRLCTPARAGRARAAWTGRATPRPAHSVHRRHFSESGQITCQTGADRSLVNNRGRIAPGGVSRHAARGAMPPMPPIPARSARARVLRTLTGTGLFVTVFPSAKARYRAPMHSERRRRLPLERLQPCRSPASASCPSHGTTTRVPRSPSAVWRHTPGSAACGWMPVICTSRRPRCSTFAHTMRWPTEYPVIGEAMAAMHVMPGERDALLALAHKAFEDAELCSDRLLRVLREIYQRYRWSQYQMVGFTIHFAQLFSSILFARSLKEDYPNVRVVLGGGCVWTGWPSPCLNGSRGSTGVTAGTAKRRLSPSPAAWRLGQMASRSMCLAWPTVSATRSA